MSSAERDRIKCDSDDFEDFGRLIYEWASGEGEIPNKTEKLKAKLRAVGIIIPKRVEQINVVFDTLKTLTIVVPPSEMIEEGEKIVEGSAEYPLPAEYELQINPKRNPDDDRKPAEAFQKFRIGEYCVGQCF